MDASLFNLSAIYYAHVGKTLHRPKSMSWRGAWAVTVCTHFPFALQSSLYDIRSPKGSTLPTFRARVQALCDDPGPRSDRRVTSRFRVLLQGPKPSGRLPRSRRTRRVLSRFSSLRQRHDGVHWGWTTEIQYVPSLCQSRRRSARSQGRLERVQLTLCDV